MKRLNRAASRAALAAGATAATDVTGFGLVGHALEMAEASGVRFRFEWDALPLAPRRPPASPGTWSSPAAPSTTSSTSEAGLTRTRSLTDGEAMLLFDPQTSGGLLVAVPAGRRGGVHADHREGTAAGAWLVGEVVEGEGLEIV